MGTRPIVLVCVALSLALIPLGGCVGRQPQTTTDQPTESETEPEYVAPGPDATTQPDSASDSASWDFKNSAGYTCSITLTVWEPIPADAVGLVAHPGDKVAESLWSSEYEPTRLIDPASDYDPKTDLVIPIRLAAENTTAEFSLEELTVVTQCAGLPVANLDYAISPARVLDFMLFYSDGTSSNSMAVSTPPPGPGGGHRVEVQFGTDPYVASTTWTSPLAPDERKGIVYFAILRDYYSPAAPAGDEALLDLLMLYPEMGTNADWVPVLETAQQGITFAGQLVPSGQ